MIFFSETIAFSSSGTSISDMITRTVFVAPQMPRVMIERVGASELNAAAAARYWSAGADLTPQMLTFIPLC